MANKTLNRIKELLAKEGRSNVELAEYLDAHVQTVSSWCTNDNQPRLSTIFKISDFLNIEARELISLKKDLRTMKSKSSRKKRPNK